MFKCIESWVEAPRKTDLKPNSVHIWGWELTATPAQLENHKQLLTPKEKERLERFYFEKHQHQFAVAHGMLHSVLSRYLHIEPALICFDYQSHGKPELTSKQNPHRLQFNLSHSGDIALLAVTKEIPIGIDVEQIKPRHHLELAKNIMSKTEYEEFSVLKDEEKEDLFFHVWTQKEAVIKALGQGLSFSLSRFSVSIRPPAQLVSLDGAPYPKEWTLQDLVMPKGYKATFACCQKIKDYFCWEI